MTTQELQAQHRQYAINELLTVDEIAKPTEQQIKTKMAKIAQWDWFKHLAVAAGVHA